jgi:opacity protein-like surface antigen
VLKGDPVLLTFAADAVRPTDNYEYVNVGAQLGWSNMLFLRGGYRALGRKDSQEGLTLGAGVRYGLEGLGAVEVNYAYNEFGLFGNLNTLSFSLAF